MTSRGCVLLTVFFAFVILLAVPAWAQNQDTQGASTSIYGCTIINKPGPYVLAKNINARRSDLKTTPGSPSPCIWITASHVTLDLRGHTISGPGAGLPVSHGILIEADIDEPMPVANYIHDGSIVNFDRGIGISGGPHTVERVRFTGNFAGIIFGGNGNRFKDVVATSNSVGIYGLGGEGNSIENCQAVSNGWLGISLLAPDSPEARSLGNRIVGNTVSGNGTYGIFAPCPSLILQNMTYNNGLGEQDNIVVTGSGCTMSDNNPAP